ncbi:Titin [Amphibalanus amphitrite]|uniref:Titin n=1 Tax=Amphibalanus amphitrite TaxID=1232801 RepID=A0A6A4V6Y5_AMPAM|nr:Titin [Amphibalanus amphitrite]
MTVLLQADVRSREKATLLREDDARLPGDVAPEAIRQSSIRLDGAENELFRHNIGEYSSRHRQHAMALRQIARLAGQPSDLDWRMVVTDLGRLNAVMRVVDQELSSRPANGDRFIKALAHFCTRVRENRWRLGCQRMADQFATLDDGLHLQHNKAHREARKESTTLSAEERRQIETICNAYLSSVLAEPPAVPTRELAVQFREILFITMSNLGGYRTGAILGSTCQEWGTAQFNEESQTWSWYTTASKTLGTYGAVLVVVTDLVMRALRLFNERLRPLIASTLPKNADSQRLLLAARTSTVKLEEALRRAAETVGGSAPRLVARFKNSVNRAFHNIAGRELREAGKFDHDPQTGAEVRAHSLARSERDYSAYGRRKRITGFVADFRQAFMGLSSTSAESADSAADPDTDVSSADVQEALLESFQSSGDQTPTEEQQQPRPRQPQPAGRLVPLPGPSHAPQRWVWEEASDESGSDALPPKPTVQSLTAQKPAAAVQQPVALQQTELRPPAQPLTAQQPPAAVQQPVALQQTELHPPAQPLTAQQPPAAVQQPVALQQTELHPPAQPLTAQQPSAVVQQPVALQQTELHPPAQPLTAQQPPAVVQQPVALQQTELHPPAQPLTAQQPPAVVQQPVALQQTELHPPAQPLTAQQPPAAVQQPVALQQTGLQPSAAPQPAVQQPPPLQPPAASVQPLTMQQPPVQTPPLQPPAAPVQKQQPAQSTSSPNEGPLTLPDGPVLVREQATGVLVMESLGPIYQQVRREFGLAPGEEYRPPTGAAADSRFARWSPAEQAIMRWLNANERRLVSRTTGMPFRSVRALVLELRHFFNFRRTATQLVRRRKRERH